MKAFSTDDYVFIVSNEPPEEKCGKYAVIIPEKVFGYVDLFWNLHKERLEKLLETTGDETPYWEEDWSDKIAKQIALMTDFDINDIHNALSIFENKSMEIK